MSDLFPAYEYWTKEETKTVFGFENVPLLKTLHRIDGPALTSFNKNGNICYIRYFLNGIDHRDDGPSIITYNEFNEQYNFRFCINGIDHTDEVIEDMRLKIFPEDLSKWTEDHKTFFKLKYA